MNLHSGEAGMTFGNPPRAKRIRRSEKAKVREPYSSDLLNRAAQLCLLATDRAAIDAVFAELTLKIADSERIAFLSELIQHCPTASFHYNDDPDLEFPGGGLMPVGFTIRVENVCEPIRVTAPTFFEAVDKLKKKMERVVATDAHGNG